MNITFTYFNTDKVCGTGTGVVNIEELMVSKDKLTIIFVFNLYLSVYSFTT